MAWFKVDDKLHAARKVMKIPRRHRLAAVGLWTIAGSWCADQETDGVVPDYMIEEWGGTTLLVKQLVSVGLWLQLEDATEFHDWAEYQPTRAQLEDGRKKNAEKLRKWRERNHDVPGHVTGLQDGSNHLRNAAPDPTRPGPTPIEEANASSLSDSEESNADGELLAANWMPTQKHHDHAVSLGLDPEAQLKSFRAHAVRNQRRQKNWGTAFTNWLKKGAEMNQQRQASGQQFTQQPQRMTAVDKARMLAADMGRKEIGS